MSATTSTPMLSAAARQELQTTALRVCPAFSAIRLWERYLSGSDRQRLGGDLEAAYRRLGTAGMWARLRGTSLPKAVVEVANTLGFLRDDDRDWLLREIGEIPDTVEAVENAIASGDLVFVERPREIHWHGELIPIDWNRHNVLWAFFLELSRNAKGGQPVDAFSFGENSHRDYVTKQKYRLTNTAGFPSDLADLIQCAGRGAQKLGLPPERIHIYEVDGFETLGEWTA